MLSVIRLSRFKSFPDFLLEKPQHPHSVFKLRIAVILLLFRDRHYCQNIPLVSGMDKMIPMLPVQFCTPLFKNPEHFQGVFTCKRFQMAEILPVSAQPHRHYRHAGKMRQIFRQIPDTALQFPAIVNTLAQNDLSVHLNARFPQPLYLRKDVPGKPVVQHPAAQLWIRSVKGNIDGREMVLDNSVDIVVIHIGQRNIISLEKGKSGIIILKVERVTHSWRHLIDKAENTAVAAGTVLVHKAVLKSHTEILLIVLLNLKLPFLTVRLAHKQLNVIIIQQIVVVEHILNLRTVD